MGALDFLRKKQATAPQQTASFTQLSDGSFFTYLNVSEQILPLKLSNDNGYLIASQLAEVFFPIDCIAEKVAKLFETVHLENSAGKEIRMNSNMQRLFSKPNIYDGSFTDLIYNFVFSELSDGNGYLYFKCPQDTEKITKDNVQSILLLQPDKVQIQLKTTEMDMLKAATIEDYIQYYDYSLTVDKISPKFIIHSKSYLKDRSTSDYRGLSPLFAAKNNVDNLLAVYQARYNVYVNNGTAYILFPQQKNQNDLAAALNPAKRDDIIKDINNRFGLTGDRQIKAVSDTPLAGLNTLVSIKDLMPLEESVANFLAIAGIFGVDKDLLPLKEGTTFTNKEVAEAKIWSDIAVSYANDICKDLTNMFGLTNEKIAVKTSDIGFLQANRKLELESDKILIENLTALKNAGINTTMQLNKLYEKYGN
jgi:hypothetical protein